MYASLELPEKIMILVDVFNCTNFSQAFIPILGPGRACADRLPDRPMRSVRSVLSGHDLAERGIGRRSRLAGPDRGRLPGVSLPLRRHDFYKMTSFDLFIHRFSRAALSDAAYRCSYVAQVSS